MSFEHPEAGAQEPTDRAATKEEIALGMRRLVEGGLEELNAKLQERFDIVKQFYDTQNAILATAGEIFRMEQVLGKNEDAGVMEKALGYVMGTKEDAERLENARMMLEELEERKEILAERLAGRNDN